MTRSSTKGHRWNQREDRTLKSTYPNFGARETQRKLQERGYERSIPSIWHRAKRLRIPYDTSYRTHLIPLSHARQDPHVCNGRERQHTNVSLIQAAKRDGVLERSTAYPHALMAPEWWVDEYMRKLDEQLARERDIAATWLPTKRVATMFQVTEGSFRAMMAPSYAKRVALLDYLKRIPRARVQYYQNHHVKPGYYWEPEAVEREARLYNVRRQRKRMRRREKHAKKGNA